jgi:hypothetical protein
MVEEGEEFLFHRLEQCQKVKGNKHKAYIFDYIEVF